MSGSPVMTYNTLKQDIERYTERGESETTDPTFFAQLPSLIMLAEKQILQDLKILGFKEVVTSTMASGTSVYAKPDRWRETISINFSAANSDGDLVHRTPLYQRDYTYLQMLVPNRSVDGVPKYYAEYNASNILISPTPDEDYPFEWSFYAIPPLLSEDNQTNWATEFVPNLLLYGSLLQAEPFLRNDERMKTWGALYESIKQSLLQDDLRKMGDGSQLRRGA